MALSEDPQRLPQFEDSSLSAQRPQDDLDGEWEAEADDGADDGNEFPFLADGTMLLFGLAIFLSAMLLFQMELIIAKYLLPWFGGGAVTWTTCMMFFQATLLGGYGWAHFCARRLALRRQGAAHLSLLMLALGAAAFWSWRWNSPLLPSPEWKPVPGAPVIPGLLSVLLAVGLPFFVLSATTPLLQSWYTRVQRSEAPYWLYALSNLGSLLGLLTYPWLLERNLTMHAQAWVWGAGFVVAALSIAICALRARRAEAMPAEHAAADFAAEQGHESAQHLGDGRGGMWFCFLLAACASFLMLAATNFITQDIAPVALLWVLPLAAYLMSFVLVFQPVRLYYRGLFHPLAALALVAILIAMFRGTDIAVVTQVRVFVCALFVLCVVLHGELSQLKPVHAGVREVSGTLTRYYLVIAAGGAAGSALVAVVVPYVLKGYWEFHAGCILALWLVLVLLWRERTSWLHAPLPWILPALIALAALVAYNCMDLLSLPKWSGQWLIGVGGAAALVALWMALSGALRRAIPPILTAAVVAAFAIVTSAAFVGHMRSERGIILARYRDPFGALLVREMGVNDVQTHRYELLNGRVNHGEELLSPALRDVPTSYYGRDSGVGILIYALQKRAPQMRVGVVGLGAGTLAAYARPGDVYRFYEINPQVVQLARGRDGYFHFFGDARGKIEIAPGDARLSLERESANRQWQDFDVLVLDAFSGDSIPVHLLTLEAVQGYLQHLRGPDSVIAIHISNYSVDLEPVVAGLAQRLDMNALMVRTPERNGVFLENHWVLLCRGTTLTLPEVRNAGFEMLRFSASEAEGLPHPPVWTDERNNILDLLK